MEWQKNPIDGVILVKPSIYQDERGFFQETWNSDKYAEIGVGPHFFQDNRSFSIRNVLRGIHFQKGPHAQGKLIQVAWGKIFDVAVDLRRDSSTFGHFFGIELDSNKGWQLWIEAGLGHGFCVLSEQALVTYKCTTLYAPRSEGSIVWNDPDLNIPWPVSNPIVSTKDMAAPTLVQWIKGNA